MPDIKLHKDHMVNVKSAELFITLITFGIVYILSVTLVGYFHAWVTEKMGDDTAAEFGFLTLNPLQHIDIMGIICLLLFRIGWGARIPIDATKISGRTTVRRWLKLYTAYWSDALAHVALATVAMTSLVLIFGRMVLQLSADMMLNGELSYMRFAQLYPDLSSLTISIALILIACIYLNVFLAVFSFVFYGLELLMMFLTENSPEYAQYSSAFTFLIYFLLVLLLVTPQLRILLVLTIYGMGLFLASLFGTV